MEKEEITVALKELALRFGAIEKQLIEINANLSSEDRSLQTLLQDHEKRIRDLEIMLNGKDGLVIKIDRIEQRGIIVWTILVLVGTLLLTDVWKMIFRG